MRSVDQTNLAEIHAGQNEHCSFIHTQPPCLEKRERASSTYPQNPGFIPYGTAIHSYDDGQNRVMTALPIARKRLSIGTVTQFVMLNKAMPDVLRIRKMRIYPDPPIWEG